MTESRLEWKASCRDDHLKSLCAFANANGGILEIGRDDDGKVVGVGARERRRLLEELPNKLRDLLGIVAPMDVREDDGVPYLRIVVEPYPVAISYRGVYYQRSGSTNQILRGPALDRFLLGKTGRCWDGMPDPRVALDDLDPATIAGFRKRAGKEKRLSGDALSEDDAGLIERLRLTDGDYLTKAAIAALQPGHRQRLLPGGRDRDMGTRDRPRSSRLQEGRDTGTGDPIGARWPLVRVQFLGRLPGERGRARAWRGFVGRDLRGTRSGPGGDQVGTRWRFSANRCRRGP